MFETYYTFAPIRHLPTSSRKVQYAKLWTNFHIMQKKVTNSGPGNVRVKSNLKAEKRIIIPCLDKPSNYLFVRVTSAFQYKHIFRQ